MLYVINKMCCKASFGTKYAAPSWIQTRSLIESLHDYKDCITRQCIKLKGFIYIFKINDRTPVCVASSRLRPFYGKIVCKIKQMYYAFVYAAFEGKGSTHVTRVRQK